MQTSALFHPRLTTALQSTVKTTFYELAITTAQSCFSSLFNASLSDVLYELLVDVADQE